MAKKVTVSVQYEISMEIEGKGRLKTVDEVSRQELQALRDWLAGLPEYQNCGAIQAGTVKLGKFIFALLPKEAVPPIVEKIKSQGWEAELHSLNRPDA